MLQINSKEDCCGCGACMNICPKKCIRMEPDEEGFLYPVVSRKNCIECGLCESVCPVCNVMEDIPFEQTAYLVQIKDESVRRESTAGGAFTAIAEYVLQQGGVVFGAAYDEQLDVVHSMVTCSSELSRFRNSKYVQSNTKTTYYNVEKLLKQGRYVCYSGTPCQIEGLKQYLRINYEKLITIDVVCHAVPSPLIWRKYLDMQKQKYGNVLTNIMFRDKHYGYKYSTMTIKGADGNEIYTYGIDTDPMLRAFFSDICDRPSCYDCKFKKRYRVSDFTIWDCFSVEKFDKTMDDDKGTTRLLIHTQKGQEVFEKIKSSIRFIEVSPDDLTEGVKEMFRSVSDNSRRPDFFRDANIMSGKELFEKYFPETMKVKAERAIRIICYKTGVYSLVKRMAKKLLRK